MKRALKIAGITVGAILAVLVLGVAGLIIKNKIDASKPLLTDDYYLAFKSSAPLEKRYSQRGSYRVSFADFDVADKAIDRVQVWYPERSVGAASRFPMILVVNGSNMKASKYAPFFDRLASWGFVVVGTEDPQPGTGATTSRTLAFMLNLPAGNGLRDVIDASRIGIVGYSQGGAGAIGAATAYPNSGAIKAMFTGSAAYSVLAKNMGWKYDASKVAVPYFMTAGTGSSEDSGARDITTEFGGVAPLSSLIANYSAMPDGLAKVRGRIVGAEHWDMQTLSDGYMTAWMRLQLQGDPVAASVFKGPKAEILANKAWQDVEKNR